MRKRTLIVLCLLATAAVLALTVVVLSSATSPGITPHNIEAIIPGMSRAEVDALMGKPPGLYDTNVSVESVPLLNNGKHWIGSRAAVYITFDARDRVVEKYPLAVKPMGRSWWRWW